jgi:hypothetical protein
MPSPERDGHLKPRMTLTSRVPGHDGEGEKTLLRRAPYPDTHGDTPGHDGEPADEAR